VQSSTLLHQKKYADSTLSKLTSFESGQAFSFDSCRGSHEGADSTLMTIRHISILRSIQIVLY